MTSRRILLVGKQVDSIIDDYFLTILYSGVVCESVAVNHIVVRSMGELNLVYQEYFLSIGDHSVDLPNDVKLIVSTNVTFAHVISIRQVVWTPNKNIAYRLSHKYDVM